MRRIAFLMVLLSLQPALAADPAEVLKATDRAFAALAQKEGPGPAFRAYAADPTTILNAVQPMKRPDEVGRGFGPDTKITWEPVDAKIAASGDLGYTWGHATISDKDKNGQPETSYSRYVTVWQKQADGHWKFVLDFGAPDPSPPKR
jgi:ketosteroid isomerase-like protein